MLTGLQSLDQRDDAASCSGQEASPLQLRLLCSDVRGLLARRVGLATLQGVVQPL